MSNNGNGADNDRRFKELWSGVGNDPLQKNSCAIAAGFKETGTIRGSNKILNTLVRNKKMQKKLDKKGVTMDRLAGKLNELLDAPHPLAKREFNPFTKELMPPPPDNFIQFKAAELGMKIHDVFAPTRISEDKTETKQIIFSAEVVQRLERFDEQTKLLEEKKKAIDVTSVSADQD
jgi:hypothetical protein